LNRTLLRASILSELTAHHIRLTKNMIAESRIALLPGDPGRVPMIAEGLKSSKNVALGAVAKLISTNSL
jgi:uridine phosphorylase